MKLLLTIFLFISLAATAQHTSPLVNAGSDINLTLPVNSTSVSASVTYYDGATMVSQRWTKVQTPRQQPYSIVIVGSSTAAGFGVTTAEYFGTKLSSYYKPLGLVDSVYNAGENGGQTIFAASITGRLNIGGSHQRKIIVLSYPSNGYNGSTYTDAQILNRFREWRDSIVNRGYEYIVMGTQPREDFSAGDRTRLNRLNDSLINIFGERFANVMKIGKNTGNDLWKTTMTIGDQVHGNGTFHTEVNNLIRAINPFRYIAENFDKIRSSTSTSTSIDSLSYKGKHLYQFGVVDSDGHGGSDIVAVNANSSCSGTRYEADPTNTGAYWDAINLQAGDTLDLKNKTFQYVAVINNSGTAGCPIVIQNSGGQAKVTSSTMSGGDLSQIRLESTAYIEVRGDGSKDSKGILIQPYKSDSIRNGSWALAVLGKSKNVAVNNIYIRNAGIGMSIKDEGQCDSTFNYPLWTIDSITVNDNLIVRTFNQGMYIGNTAPDNRAGLADNRPVNCSGVTKYPMPARMGNVRVFNNYVDSTGRAGIQLSSASTGSSAIYNNTIRYSGLTGDEQQGAGINIGAYSKVSVYNNTIFKTLTYGISSFGASGTNFTLQINGNNLDSSGFQVHYNATGIFEYSYTNRSTVANNLTFPYSIFVCTKPTENPIDSTRFSIQNNSLGRRKNSGGGIGLADYQNTFHKSGNFICNNLNSFNGLLAGIVREESIFVWYGTNCTRRKFKLKVR